jgi:NAD(P)-dependent dehydrogenase (short-subunit alcohol dehydrogenase family)
VNEAGVTVAAPAAAGNAIAPAAASIGFIKNLIARAHQHVLAINVLAPYVLTAMMLRPGRLVYLSSGMHLGGDPDLDDLSWERRRRNEAQAYSDSKLLDTALAFAVAQGWPDVAANAVSPGWVTTKMGGSGAPDDLELAPRTQVEASARAVRLARGDG